MLLVRPGLTFEKLRLDDDADIGGRGFYMRLVYWNGAGFPLICQFRLRQRLEILPIEP